MKVKRRYQACLLALSILVASLPVAGITASRAQPGPVSVQTPAHAPAEAHEPFKFGKVDLELLAQINLLDQRFEKEGLVYHEAGLDAYLDRVGKAVLADKEIENVNWKFRALRDPVPNALALPNGSIYINTGLLALLEEEGQLASVLAHEVIHVNKRHTYQQNRSLRKKILAINILSTVGAWNPVGGAAGMAIDLIANISPFMLVLSIFGYSRELEKEADLEGLKNLSAAGYAPDQMVGVFKLLQKDIEGEQLGSFYNDHPKLRDRITYISNSINNSAKKLSDEELRNAQTAYLTQMEQVDRHDVELAIKNGRFHSAYYVSRKLVDFHPDSSEDVFYLAEAYRTLGPRMPELTAAELTGGAKKKAAKNRNKRTMEEQDAELLKTPAGQQAWKTNQQKAEELYLGALELNRFNYLAHRGLGMLYEKIGRKDEATSQYRKYLELAPNAFDSERIRRRLEALRALQTN
ncbi:MAG TPA: M48 family metalloprotease [Pyrinomonadaceae bacterium]